MKNTGSLSIVFFFCLLVQISCQQHSAKNEVANSPAKTPSESKWIAPDTTVLANDSTGLLIKYGRDLIAHTSYYLGPDGIISHGTNGMNCQNCHLQAGTKFFGNNYSAVASTYPKFRARSGSLETVQKRINDCIERSLNGSALDTNSREMQAIAAYINWIGSKVPKDSVPAGAGLVSVPFMLRPADTANGKIVFEKRCTTCHGLDGQGKRDTTVNYYLYPPLWGAHSYNVSAGLFRLSRLAGFIKANMPFDITDEEQRLTDEEAWDVAAYINTRTRPNKRFAKDWPDISKKPFDHPFGPYTDSFSESQHKLGPFTAIVSAQKK